MHKSRQLTGNFTQMPPEAPGSQSKQGQHQDRDAHANADRKGWRHQQTNRISVQECQTSRPVRSQLKTAVNYRYPRKRMDSAWEKPGTVQWGTGPVSDTPCWTRGYTSSPPPLLLYTCKFIKKNKTQAFNHQLITLTLAIWFYRTWDAHLAQRLQTSQAWSGTQNVPSLHWHLVSDVVVQGAVSISSEGGRKRGETFTDGSLYQSTRDNKIFPNVSGKC